VVVMFGLMDCLKQVERRILIVLIKRKEDTEYGTT
jgi:hypothetical protein